MCSLGKHVCYCGVEYICEDPTWLCPSINEDENGYMCVACEMKAAAEMEHYYAIDIETNSEKL